MHLPPAGIPAAVIVLSTFAAATSTVDDKEMVRSLDTRYQAAVRTHDVATMDSILADNFILVNGAGKVFSKSDLLEEARDTGMVYQRQGDSRQTVRLWGKTAVITALLWAKGTRNEIPFDYHLWFSDTYVKTASGWRYVFGQASLPLPDPPSHPAAACAAPEFRQFDFFAGDWDTYDVADSTKVVARNQVTIILDGCVLREVYRQAEGLVGESFSLYDAARGGWHQSWVTNRGTLLLLDGGMEGDRMVLTGTEKTTDGRSSLLRGIWRREGAGVRETAERSTDGGKTWKPVFDILFRKHGRPGTP
jgi:hypothetical protein